MNKDPDLFKYAFNDPNSLFNTPFSNGKTLLYLSTQEGKYDIVKLLISKGLDPSIKSKVNKKI